jgi:hypothetical protein
MSVHHRLSQLERAAEPAAQPACPSCGQRPLVVVRLPETGPDRCLQCQADVAELPAGAIVLAYVTRNGMGGQL